MLLRRALTVARQSLAHSFPIYVMGFRTSPEFLDLRFADSES
jgi:hypothetical protein